MSIRQVYVLDVLTIFVILFHNANCQNNSKCITPNGEDVLCVPLYSCKVITDALLTEDEGAIEFAKQSSCGPAEDSLVCCGSTGYHTEQDVIECFYQASEIADDQDQAVILADFKTKDIPDRTVCGLWKWKSLKWKTKIYEHPWIVALEYVSKVDGSDAGIRCVGSIINNRYILTSANCMASTEFRLKNVRLGEWRLSTNPDCVGIDNIDSNECNDEIQVIEVEEEIPHAYYYNGNNDIGLLKLERPFNYTKFIRPICLPPINLPAPVVGARFTIAGWGLLNETSEPDYKLKVDVPLSDNSDCNKLSSERIPLVKFCAGGEGTNDSCVSDSGSPLMSIYQDRANKQTQWYLEGVVSWGKGCGKPSIYTRIPRYINWILRHISEG